MDVDGSNPFARSIFFIQGGIAKWLRQRSAKPLFTGSNPVAASRNSERVAWYHATLFLYVQSVRKRSDMVRVMNVQVDMNAVNMFLTAEGLSDSDDSLSVQVVEDPFVVHG